MRFDEFEKEAREFFETKLFPMFKFDDAERRLERAKSMALHDIAHELEWHARKDLLEKPETRPAQRWVKSALFQLVVKTSRTDMKQAEGLFNYLKEVTGRMP